MSWEYDNWKFHNKSYKVADSSPKVVIKAGKNIFVFSNRHPGQSPNQIRSDRRGDHLPRTDLHHWLWRRCKIRYRRILLPNGRDTLYLKEKSRHFVCAYVCTKLKWLTTNWYTVHIIRNYGEKSSTKSSLPCLKCRCRCIRASGTHRNLKHRIFTS